MPKTPTTGIINSDITPQIHPILLLFISELISWAYSLHPTEQFFISNPEYINRLKANDSTGDFLETIA